MGPKKNLPRSKTAEAKEVVTRTDLSAVEDTPTRRRSQRTAAQRATEKISSRKKETVAEAEPEAAFNPGAKQSGLSQSSATPLCSISESTAGQLHDEDNVKNEDKSVDKAQRSTEERNREVNENNVNDEKSVDEADRSTVEKNQGSAEENVEEKSVDEKESSAEEQLHDEDTKDNMKEDESVYKAQRSTEELNHEVAEINVGEDKSVDEAGRSTVEKRRGNAEENVEEKSVDEKEKSTEEQKRGDNQISEFRETLTVLLEFMKSEERIEKFISPITTPVHLGSNSSPETVKSKHSSESHDESDQNAEAIDPLQRQEDVKPNGPYCASCSKLIERSDAAIMCELPLDPVSWRMHLQQGIPSSENEGNTSSEEDSEEYECCPEIEGIASEEEDAQGNECCPGNEDIASEEEDAEGNEGRSANVGNATSEEGSRGDESVEAYDPANAGELPLGYRSETEESATSVEDVAVNESVEAYDPANAGELPLGSETGESVASEEDVGENASLFI